MVADYAVDSFHYSGNSVAARLGTEPSRNFNSSPACVGADDCGRRCRNQPENRLNRGGILGVGARLTPAPMLRLMPHQSPFRLFHLVFEASRLFFVPIRSVKSIERIDKPAVPKLCAETLSASFANQKPRPQDRERGLGVENIKLL